MAIRLAKQDQTAIITYLVDQLKTGLSTQNVFRRFKYADELNDFPAVCLYNSYDQRSLQQTNVYGGELHIKLRGYVRNENAVSTADTLIHDIETVLENLNLSEQELFEGIQVRNISTDEGLFTPLGIVHMELAILYQ